MLRFSADLPSERYSLLLSMLMNPKEGEGEEELFPGFKITLQCRRRRRRRSRTNAKLFSDADAAAPIVSICHGLNEERREKECRKGREIARNRRGNFTQPSERVIAVAEMANGVTRTSSTHPPQPRSFLRSFALLVLNEGGDFMEMPARAALALMAPN